MKKLLLSISAICFSLITSFAQILPTAVDADPTFNGGLQLSNNGVILTPIGSSFASSAYLYANVSNGSSALGTGIIPAGSIRLDVDFPASFGVNNLAISVPNWTVQVATSTAGAAGHLELVNNVAIAEGEDLPAVIPIVAYTVASNQTVTATIALTTPFITADVVAGNNLTSAALTTTAVLPVSLAAFNAKVRGCNTQIDWASKTEVAFSRYELQHSQDGTDYRVLATVAPKGNGSSYSYAHNNAPEGANYYRLKMIDHDGSYEYSGVEKVTVNCSNIQLAPTVTTGTARIMGLSGNETIKVINSVGQVLISQQAQAATETIDMSRYAAGLYQVMVVRGSEQLFSGKIVKQ